MYTLRFQRKWEGAHRLISGRNANTLCSQPHGHTWAVEVRLELRNEIALNGEDNVLVLFQAAKKRGITGLTRQLTIRFSLTKKIRC